MKNFKTGIGAALLFLWLMLACSDSETSDRPFYSSPTNYRITNNSPAPTASPSAALPGAKNSKPSKTNSNGKTNKKPDSQTNRQSYSTPAPKVSNQSGATARCRDGTLSYSQSRRGTCSHHGGVAVWY